MTQPCSRCGHANPVGKKFCTQCGQPLSHKCVNCGAELTPEDKFCGECGAGQAAPASAPAHAVPPSAPSPRQKPVSVAAPANAELRVFRGHTATVTCVAASPDGRHALSGDDKGGLRFWDLDTGQWPFPLPGHQDEVTAVAFSPGGRFALSAAGFIDKTIRVWDTATGQEKVRLEGHTDRVTAAVFSPDGKSILSGSEDNTVRLWDVGSGFEMVRLLGHTGAILAVGLSPDGRQVFSAANDMTIRVWDPEADHELRRHQMNAMYENLTIDCAFSPDGSRALSTDPDGIQVWDLATGAKLRTLSGHGGNIFAVAFSPDGGRILSCAGTDYFDDQLRADLGGIDNTVRLWDLRTGRELCRFEGHQRNVNCVAFLPDGRRALSGSSDTTVRLWSLPA